MTWGLERGRVGEPNPLWGASSCVPHAFPVGAPGRGLVEEAVQRKSLAYGEVRGVISKRLRICGRVKRARLPKRSGVTDYDV